MNLPPLLPAALTLALITSASGAAPPEAELASRFRAAPSLLAHAEAIVSAADLDYTSPVTRSEEGMPLGNGRMGSLVWTTPSAVKFQINRVDVFGQNASTTSFPRADTDYASGCGYVDINVVQSGEDVFGGNTFNQHLSLYEGLVTIKGKDITVRAFAWHERDVMAIEIDDRRDPPEPVNIDLRMLRYAIQFIKGRNYELAADHAVAYQTAEHTATSKLDIRDERILLTQKFEEHDFYSSSAVAIGVVGRPAKARYLNESTIQLSAAPGKGRFTILIASAGSFDRNQDAGALALDELNAAASKSFDALLADNRAWWQDFWSKSLVRLHSADGQADFVGQNYTYFLYIMGSTSRGKYPPRFGGMLWYTNGDMRRWGSQYWWANTNAYYQGLMAANRIELMEPMFSMYSGMYDSCALAARQQWGSQGIWIPEIVFFDGLEELPDPIAAELRDLMLARKPYEERSPEFQAFAEVRNRHHARWNFQADGWWENGRYIVPTKDAGIFGHCTHILGAGARIAALYWQRYQYTMNENWLRDRAYPMIKGAAEFYRHFPNLKKGEDGLYHIHHVNNGESRWNSSDSVYEVNRMHMIFPLAIRASEILGVDADLRDHWREIKDHLVPAPGQNYRGGGGGGFVYEGPGAIEPLGSEPELKTRFLGFNRLGSFIDVDGIGGAQIFRNRLRLREGPGAIDCENLGALAANVHNALLQSTPETEEKDPVLRLFNGWPKDWEAEFTLLARGAFLVSSAQKDGAVSPVEILSQAGSICRLRNPWGESDVRLERDGRDAEILRGELLEFPTRAGERIVVKPASDA
jgi:hypothetical protein